MYSFYNVTFRGLGCAAWVREGFLFFFCWVFFGYLLKNSTINAGFGTHLRKTAQPTNIEGRGQFIPERGARRDGESTRERQEGSPVVVLLLAQRGREGIPTHCRQVTP